MTLKNLTLAVFAAWIAAAPAWSMGRSRDKEADAPDATTGTDNSTGGMGTTGGDADGAGAPVPGDTGGGTNVPAAGTDPGGTTSPSTGAGGGQ
jgi:hypothetical protein